MFRSLRDWYLRVFLPFEQPDHPLYAAPAVEEDLSDWDDLGTEFLHAPHQIEFTVSSDPDTIHRI